MIVPVTEENLMDAARVHAAAWRESHREPYLLAVYASHQPLLTATQDSLLLAG